MEIERVSFTAPWSLAMFLLEMSKPESVCLAAVDTQGEFVGYLVCTRLATVWHLMNVAVPKAFRRQRIATTLVNHLFERTAVPGTEYTLEVRVSNTEAISMYGSFGFTSAGIRRGYYQDDGEDALIMWYTHAAAAETATGH